MNTPILDFIENYIKTDAVRLHMPGHKGKSFLGFEQMDITEIHGADALYEADGIIRESEANTASLFSSGRTVFSAEGSSQCIKAMLYLSVQAEKTKKRNRVMAENARQRPLFLAARNVHKAFIYGCALLDADVSWIPRGGEDDLLSCRVSKEALDRILSKMPEPPTAVYVTSPDYLGHMADIRGLSEVCHRHETILLVDNAHGAYLHFLEEPKHPLDLGADFCCDSAHKTFPVLTGGAYLHASKQIPKEIRELMKQAMEPFGSTSPSYLIMASLDCCNRYLSEGYREKLEKTIAKLKDLRKELGKAGWKTEEEEPLKITVRMPEGVTGTEMSERLSRQGIECEYADPEFLVCMLTPENTEEDRERFRKALGENKDNFREVQKAGEEKTENGIYKNEETDRGLHLEAAPSVMSIREALFSLQEDIPSEKAVGRIAASPTVSCPPAIPVVTPGELVTENAVLVLKRYGIETVRVVR